MKRNFLLTVILLLSCFTADLNAQCKLADIVKTNKLNIPSPYKYDGFTMTNIIFDDNTHLLKTEFMAFKGQKYKLVFCTSGFDEEVNISIFNKSNPKQKITEKIVGGQETTWIYEIEKSGSYAFVFDIPAGEPGVNHKECIVMMIGFTDK